MRKIMMILSAGTLMLALTACSNTTVEETSLDVRSGNDHAAVVVEQKTEETMINATSDMEMEGDIEEAENGKSVDVDEADAPDVTRAEEVDTLGMAAEEKANILDVTPAGEAAPVQEEPALIVSESETASTTSTMGNVSVTKPYDAKPVEVQSDQAAPVKVEQAEAKQAEVREPAVSGEAAPVQTEVSAPVIQNVSDNSCAGSSGSCNNSVGNCQDNTGTCIRIGSSGDCGGNGNSCIRIGSLSDCIGNGGNCITIGNTNGSVGNGGNCFTIGGANNGCGYSYSIR